MKKLLIAILTAAVVFSVLCFSSCGKNKIDAVSLVCDKTEVAPGEIVKVKVHMNECSSVACFSYEITADDLLSVSEKEQIDSGDFIVSSSADENNLMIAGIVPTVYDVKDLDLYEIVYKVSDTAETGKKIRIILDTTQFMLGKDKNGDVTEDVCDNIAPVKLTLKVK